MVTFEKEQKIIIISNRKVEKGEEVKFSLFLRNEYSIIMEKMKNFFQSSISLAHSAKLLVRVSILVLFSFFVRAVCTIGNSSFSRSSKTSTLLPTLVAPSVANYG